MIQIASWAAKPEHCWIPSTAEGEWITFWLDSTPGLSKTQRWVVRAKADPNMNHRLGVIKWFGRWRKYSFFPEPGCVFEEKCLADISEFMTKRTKDHRDHARTSKPQQ